MSGPLHYDDAEPKGGDDCSFVVWRHIFRAIVEHERQALASGETIQFEFELVQYAGVSRRSIVQMTVVCEPGKPARLHSDPASKLGDL
jgi:hypothetical protein